MSLRKKVTFDSKVLQPKPKPDENAAEMVNTAVK